MSLSEFFSSLIKSSSEERDVKPRAQADFETTPKPMTLETKTDLQIIKEWQKSGKYVWIKTDNGFWDRGEIEEIIEKSTIQISYQDLSVPSTTSLSEFDVKRILVTPAKLIQWQQEAPKEKI